MMKFVVYLYRTLEARFYEIRKTLPRNKECKLSTELEINELNNKIYKLEKELERKEKLLSCHKHLSVNRKYDLYKDYKDICYLIYHELYKYGTRFSNLFIVHQYGNSYIVRDMEKNVAMRIEVDENDWR